jgi:hypothetical protein
MIGPETHHAPASASVPPQLVTPGMGKSAACGEAASPHETRAMMRFAEKWPAAESPGARVPPAHTHIFGLVKIPDNMVRLTYRDIRIPAYCRNRTRSTAPGRCSLQAAREVYRAVCLLELPVASSTASAGWPFLVLSSFDRLASHARSLDGVLTGGVAMPNYLWRMTAHISRF